MTERKWDVFLNAKGKWAAHVQDADGEWKCKDDTGWFDYADAVQDMVEQRAQARGEGADNG